MTNACRIISSGLVWTGLVTLGGCPRGSGGDTGGGDGTKGETVEQSIVNGGRSRTFVLHVPGAYDGASAVPLVVLLHGTGQNGKAYVDGAGWGDLADQAGFILLAPNALPVQRDKEASLANPTLWDFAVLGSGEGNDVQFIDAAVADVSSRYNVDAKRIYCVGHSSGGGMTYLLGILRREKFAAIGVVAAPFVGVSADVGITMPTIYIQGTADPIVPIEGGDGNLLGGLVPPLETSLAGWAAVLGCATPRNAVSNDGGVSVAEFAGCAGAAPFRVILIEGQGHRWPGGSVPNSPAFVIGPSTGLLNATETIWSFLNGKSK